jgi:cell division transport system permease protein
VITFVVFSLRRAWQGFWRNALMSLAATLTMVLMLLLLAGFFVLQNVLLASLGFVEQKVEVVAYLQQNAAQSQTDDLVLRLEAMPEVASVEYVSRDEALRRFKEAQAAQG